MNTDSGRVWGRQSPFERNALQRTMTLTGVVGVFGVAAILLVHAGVGGVLGSTLICAGFVSALAAASRHRYVRESLHGFEVLRSRGGGFVIGSALAFAAVGCLVTVLVLLE